GRGASGRRRCWGTLLGPGLLTRPQARPKVSSSLHRPGGETFGRGVVVRSGDRTTTPCGPVRKPDHNTRGWVSRLPLGGPVAPLAQEALGQRAVVVVPVPDDRAGAPRLVGAQRPVDHRPTAVGLGR